ncbi:hypothetical protein VPH35_091949 [Triticum aestivum]
MDRLSDLPDDVLIHILSFGPSREAARTTTLSRRWRRPLWLHTAAINIDYRSYTTDAGGVPLQQRAVDDADHALAFQKSLGRGPRKVSLVMRDGTMHDDILRAACGRDENAAIIEELRIECLEYGGRPHYIRAAPPRWTYYDLSLVWLPFAGFRVLDLTGCILHTSTRPRLRRLSFSQVHTFQDLSCSYTAFNFKSWPAPPDLAQVHLALHSNWVAGGLRRSMLMTVCHVRVLSLTMCSISDLAGYGLSQFHKLERLEIEELCGCIVNHSKAADAVENLLRNCPVVRDLHHRLRWREYLAETSDPADQIAAGADLTPCRSVNQTGYDDDEEECCESLDLYYRHCSRDRLNCLKGSLKRVVVEFDAEELTCFQVRLIRFLARDAAGLEERSPPRAVTLAPLWPLTWSEFPLPVKAAVALAPMTPPCSDVEVDNGLQFYDDNDDEEDEDEDENEDDVSPRHFMHAGRKKKNGGELECFRVKLKAKDSKITVRPRRGGANRRRRNGCGWFGEEGADIAGSSASPPPVPAISSPQRLPAMYEFPPLPCAPPPTPPILPSTAPLGLCPADITCVRREWRAVRLADLDVAADMTLRRRYLSRRRPMAPATPSGRRCAAAFRIHQPF